VYGFSGVTPAEIAGVGALAGVSFPWQEKLVAPLIATHLMENVQPKEKTDVSGKKLNYGLCITLRAAKRTSTMIYM
jgi:hypothetical protein